MTTSKPNRSLSGPDPDFRLGPRALAGLAVALGLLAIWVSRFPPMVDLPQHMAQAGYLNHLFLLQSGAVDSRTLCAMGFKPYHLFHWLAALLLYLFPVSVAVRLAMSLIFLAYAASAAFLWRVFQADKWLYLSALLWFFGLTYAWGLASNLMALPFVFLSLGFARLAVNGNGRAAWGLGLSLMGAAVIHPVPFAMALFTVVVLFLLYAVELKNRLAAFLSAGLPGAVGSVYYLLFSAAQTQEYSVASPTPPLWRKVLLLPRYAAGLFTPAEPEILLVALVVLALIGLCLLSWRVAPDKEPRCRSLLAALLFLPYFAVPEALWTMYNLYGRLLPLPLAALALAFHADLRSKPARLLRGTVVVASLLFLFHNALGHYEWGRANEGLDEAISALPDGARSLGVVYWSPTDPSRLNAVNHLHAYAQAVHGGVYSYSFSHQGKMPVVDCDRARQAPTAALDNHPEAFEPAMLSETDFVLLRWPYGSEEKNPFKPLIQTREVEQVLSSGVWRLYRVLKSGT